jgi:hypothetical protein
MAVSKLTPEDAQEWLATLQLVGEGWWRQVALAIKANAHKALGMDRREFTRQIGQRLIDPREAIVELHGAKHSNQEIADVLRVSSETVQIALYEAGIGPEPKRLTTRAVGGSDDEGTRAGGDTDAIDLDAEVKQLEADLAVEREAARRDREAATEKARLVREKHKEKVDALAERGVRLAQELEDAKNGDLDPGEKRRIGKEHEARLAKIEAGFAPVYLRAASEKIAGATDELREAVRLGLTTKHNKDLERIEKNIEAFNDELGVAQAMAGKAVSA